jgi:thymidylate kinase
MVKVVVLEGVHGVGKTETIKLFKNNYVCLTEDFIPKTKTKFSPQGFYAELYWGIKWFERLENLCNVFYNKETQKYNGGIVITDRSPYSSIIYGPQKTAHKMKPCIDEIRKEFEQKNIFIYLIYLKNDIENIWKNIQNRLKKETWRKDLKENDKEHLKNIFKKYESFKWDQTFTGSYQKNIENFIKKK